MVLGGHREGGTAGTASWQMADSIPFKHLQLPRDLLSFCQFYVPSASQKILGGRHPAPLKGKKLQLHPRG